MPWDRHWAVTHDASKFDPDDPRWVMCRNFMIGVATPKLTGIWATLDEATETITLRHADLPNLTFRPDDPDGVAHFLAWVEPLCPADKRTPTGIISVKDRGMTDSAYPSVSIFNAASHAQVEDFVGAPIERERWRGNIWLDGAAPWEEFEWTGRDLRIGTAHLRVQEPIRRCMATAGNPRTGERDMDLLAVLREVWDHQHFGVYAEVVKSGVVALGDSYEVL